MTTITAKVIKDSIYDGHRLTTLELHYPRIILAELNTHRQLSKNTSSSRAIPVEKIISNVLRDPYVPLQWGLNQKGMSSFTNADEATSNKAKDQWLRALSEVVERVEELINLGIHKQFANRILEPWSHVNTVISGTEWENFFKLRISKYAQPEIRDLAMSIKVAMDNSIPKKVNPILDIDGGWHIPYILEDEEDMPTDTKIKISVARCARVSYKSNTTNKLSSIDEDIALFERLKENRHLSPFEHIATPYKFDNANFVGWKQYRKFLEREFEK